MWVQAGGANLLESPAAFESEGADQKSHSGVTVSPHKFKYNMLDSDSRGSNSAIFHDEDNES